MTRDNKLLDLIRGLSCQEKERLIARVHCYPWASLLERYQNVAIVYTFIFLRISVAQILRLRTDEVNFEKNYCLIKNGKEDKEDLYVPIHANLLPVLRCYQRERSKELNRSVHFFTSIKSGKPLTERNVEAVFQKLADQGGSETPLPFQ